MQKQIDLTINFDWSRVQQMYRVLKEQHRAGKFDKDSHHVEAYHGTQYNLGAWGSLVYSNGLSPNWTVWNGKLLESIIPWSNQVREQFKDLNFLGMSWSETTASIALHRDGQIDKNTVICHLIYIVDCEDPMATTISYKNNKKHKVFPSIPGTTYLIDPNYFHEVVSTGHRKVIIMKFKNKFHYLARWFDKIGPLAFGQAS